MAVGVQIDTVMLGGAGAGTSATYGITIFLAALLGASDGVAQGSLFGAAGCLPAQYTQVRHARAGTPPQPRPLSHGDSSSNIPNPDHCFLPGTALAMQAVCAGTSYSGLVVSLLRIATKAALPMTASGLRSSAFLYFGIASVTVALCIAIDGAVIPRLPIVKHYKTCSSAPSGSLALESSKKGIGPPAPYTPATESHIHITLWMASGCDQHHSAKCGGYRVFRSACLASACACVSRWCRSQNRCQLPRWQLRSECAVQDVIAFPAALGG